MDRPRVLAPLDLPAWFIRVGVGSCLFLAMVGAAVVAVVALGAASDVTVPLLVAVFLAVVLIPVVDWLERHRIARPIGAAGVLVVMVVVLAGTITLVVAAVGSEREEISLQLDQASSTVHRWIDGLDPATISEWRDRLGDSAGNAAGRGLVAGLVGVAGSAVALVAGLVFGAMVVYYLLKDGHRLAAWATDDHRRLRGNPFDLPFVRTAARSIQSYAKGITVLAAIQGVLIGAGAAVLGVPVALGIGVINFVGAYVPYLGALVGGAMAVLLALAGGGLSLAVVMLAVVLVVNLVVENALQPKLLGTALDLHPLIVLIATVLGGIFAGIVGLILAAPITAVARSVLGRLQSTGFFDRNLRREGPTAAVSHRASAPRDGREA